MDTPSKLIIEATALHYKPIVATQVLLLSLIGILICVPTTLIIFRLKSKSMDIQLLKIIILIDFFISISLLVNYILWYFPKNLLVYNQDWCRTQCLILIVPLLIGGYLISLLSVERYLLIVFNKSLGPKVYLILAGFLIIYPLSVSFYFSVTNSVILSSCGLYCTATVAGMKTKFGLYSSATLGLVTAFTTAWCYIGISIFRYKQLSQTRQYLNYTKIQVLRKATSTVLKSITILLLFLTSHLGKTIVFLMEWISGTKRAILADAITFNLLCYTSLVDVLLFLNFNDEVRIELFRLMGELKNFSCL
ncbi:hypothetical protein CONCODRAFT_4959 [Conidiobolus coronatus NRRL 28638]|uniref:G-protein coupled receptors family 1 profile domain-containing protein n=1 Tax=Conidiobolus coronatus (strain ATCC 28846 / CBS 209.66 / NRRL 28638) TaxID=796925 RepID=A0A137PB60_CONC2|nr:hypothetical protein CONCODRAFT_4959 [Conidiobolus coronatus NRRL 28638]|eukprot:KXN72214.1 hypothetical protein CONCODRAFT_4959 [Conidiobolus coronatus NRRL 28638]